MSSITAVSQPALGIIRAMSKSQATGLGKHKVLLGAGIVIVVILLSVFLVRGWVRMTITPKAIQTVYGNQAEKVYQDEVVGKLQDPLALLGYSDVQPLNNGCYTVLANKLKTQVDCQYTIMVGNEVPTTPEGKQTLNDNAAKLQASLQANGWEGEYSNDSEYTSLVKLMSSLTSDIDYQPDATYSKRIGDIECTIANNTAFSLPSVPKFSTRIWCAKTYTILGQPTWN